MIFFHGKFLDFRFPRNLFNGHYPISYIYSQIFALDTTNTLLYRPETTHYIANHFSVTEGEFTINAIILKHGDSR